MTCGKQSASFFKKALLAAAVAAFLHIPSISEARVLSGSVTERKQNRKIASMLKAAQKNFDTGKIQPAIDSYWKILEIDPGETFAYLELGEIYAHLRIFDRAVELLEPGLGMAEREMDKDTICYYYCILTNAYLGLSQTGLANKALLKAAEASPRNPMPRKVMGDIYLANDRIADAIKAYKKALELDPGYQPAAEKLGELVTKYGDQPPTRAKDKQAIQGKAVKLPDSEKTAAAQPKPAPRPKTETTPVSIVKKTESRPTPATEDITPIELPTTSPTAATEPPPTVPKPIPEATVSPRPQPIAPQAAPVATTIAAPTTANVDSSEIENQIDKLLAGTPEEKSAAVSFFVKLEEKGLTEIEELLYDPDPEVRILAIRTLPEFKAFSQRVRTMLQDASEDPDPMVAEEISKALQNL
jgi:Tfp pilus assembly protein PilF